MNAINFFSGLTIGLGVGVLYGALNAPDKGYKTRKRLSKKARKQWKKLNS